jgi:3-hydroxyacyl-[acyl-carrier-protein] dehydratase
MKRFPDAGNSRDNNMANMTDEINESSGKLVNLDILEIQKYLRNRYPFLMIDKVEEVIPGKSAKGYKNLTVNEWYFQGHFPGHPIMPGALQLEALFNMAAMALHTIQGNENAMSYVARVSDAFFLGHASPGDRLDIEIEIVSWKRGLGRVKGLISIDGKVVCKAEYTIVLAESLPKMEK